MCHIRELSSQIAEVYSKLVKYTNIKVSDYTTSGKADGCHVVVSTIGQLKNALTGRKQNMDLSELRMLVIDEADIFFSEK